MTSTVRTLAWVCFPARRLLVPRLLTCSRRGTRQLQTSGGSLRDAAIADMHPSSGHSSDGRVDGAAVKTHRLVIFDKNGTLINFHSIWTPWVQGLIERIVAFTGLQLEEKIFKKLDICKFTKKTRSGILAEGTTFQIKSVLCDLLQLEGFSLESAQNVVEVCWTDCDTSDPKTLQQMADLKELFLKLKLNGTKIALMTSGNRGITERTFRKLDLLPHIDMMMCGDDLVANDTEDRCNKSRVLALCSTLGVEPYETVVVGDTAGDVEAGRQAHVGRTIGVLSGIGNRLDLAPHADVVLDSVQDVLPYIFTPPEQGKDYQVLQQGNSAKPKASLVIFDKDGTLICFNSMWTPWAMKLVNRLEQITGLNLANKILSELGFCHDTQRWRPGILAEGTTCQNKELVKSLLEREGLSVEKAESVISQVWCHSDHSSEGNSLRTLDDLGVLFKALHDQGIKIAVCTADSRKATEQFLLSQHDAQHYVDMLVCGDDCDAEPKPSAHNALKICEALGIPPHETVVVGDTSADMGMGRRAKLGATVAVLSGVGQVQDLDHQADVMLHSIKDLLPLVI